MMCPTFFHRGLIVALAAMVGWRGQYACGEQSAAAYRRILVPADNPAGWPRGDVGLLPIEASDFERWVALANKPASTARIVAAEYSARLDEDRLLDAHGWWQIECTGGRSAWLSLDSCSLKVQDAHWRHANMSAARIGWSLRKNSGKLVHGVDVPERGILDFSWPAIKGVASAETQIFRFDLPISNQTRLVLDLPAFRRPLVESGVVLEQPTSEDVGGHWTLALAPRISHELRIENTRRSADSAAGKSMRQKCHFHVQQTGIELQVRVLLSSIETLPPALQIRLPNGYQLASAKCNGLELDWCVQSQDIDRNRVTVNLPAATQSHKAEIVMVAWAQFTAGTEHRLSFPQVDGMPWNSGEIQVEIDESLQLCEADAVGCLQTRQMSHDAALRGGRLLHFSAYSSKAAVNCMFQHRPVEGALQTGVSLELSGAQTVAQVISRIEIERGSLHRLSAELNRGWIVDSVESRPADAVSEWYVDHSIASHSLQLQFRDALTPDEGIEVIVNSRCASASTNAISVNELMPLRWRQLQSKTQLLRLKPADQFELAIDGPWIEVDERSLSNRQRSLLVPDRIARTAYINDQDRTMVRLMPRQIAYDATIQLEGTLADDRCDLEFRLACTPHGGGIDHVLVYFARPPEMPLAWHEVETGRRLNAEEVLQSDPRLGGLPAGGHMWRLEFGRLYARQINITAKQSFDCEKSCAIPLVALPDASTQQGRVTIATRDIVPTIVQRNLAPAPLPVKDPSSMAAAETATICAAYRFQPTRFYDSASPPELEIEPGPSAIASSPFITRLDVASQYAVDGAGKHFAVLELNGGATSQFDLQFPEGFLASAAEVDRFPILTQHTNHISIPLTRQSFHRVTVELVSRGPQLTNGCRLVPPLPKGECAILAGEWSVQLPAGFFPQSSASEREADSCVRLFGCFARVDGRPFNPLSPGDWNSLWADAARWFAPSAAAAADGDSLSDRTSTAAGLKAHRYLLGTATPEYITVSHNQATKAVGIALFIVCAVGAQMARLPLRWSVWLAASTATLSLIFPVEWAALATSATWGFAAAAAWNCLQYENRSRITAVVLAVIVATMPVTVQGATSKPRIERVFVPVDANRNQVGTKYFVPTEFLKQVLTASEATHRESAWLIAGMRCDGTLATASSQNTGAGGKWQITFEVESTARDVDVELPLERNEAKWNRTASVDGIPALLNWKSDGHGCKIRVPEPGPATISILLAPVRTEIGPRARIRLALPPMSGAKIKLQGPRSLESLNGKNISFVRQDTADRSTWHGELGENGILELDWSFDDTKQETNKSIRPISLLQLLHIGQDGLALDLVLAQRGEAEWPETLRLFIDEGWQHVADDLLELKPLAIEAAKGRRAVDVSIPPAARSAGQLRLRFVPDDSSHWGRINPPSFDIESVDHSDRWLAVVWDSSIECRASTPVNGNSGLPAVLAAALNLGDRHAPTIVANMGQLDAAWHLSVRPVVPRSTVRDRLSIAAGRDQFRIHYQIDVVPQGADKFGWTISVPSDLTVETVAVFAGQDPVPVEWVRNGADHVNLFFNRRLDQPYRVELQGALPMPPNGNLPVPRIGTADDNRTNQIVALYREVNVAAEWQFAKETPWVEGGASLVDPFDDCTQFVQAFTTDAASEGQARIAVDGQEPLLSGMALTRLSRGTSGWEATWKCDLQVEQGAIDTLQLEAPTEWAGPFDVSSTAAFRTLLPVPPRATNSITLRLSGQARAGDTIRLEICSPLATVDGQGISAPRIRLTSNGRRTEYLSLPTSLDGEPIAWTRSGLEPEELPPFLRDDDQTHTSQASFRLVGDSLNVSLRPKVAVNELASIRLAETTAVLSLDGGLIEVTRFLVSPAGLTHCEMSVPPGRKLTRTNVDGNPALVRQIEPRRVEVQFRHPQLPQTLDVVTQSKAKMALPTERIEFCQPVLEESGRAMAISLSLWTLRGEFASRLPQTQSLAAVSPAQLAAVRLDWWNSISQRASGAVLEAAALDGYSWLVHWTGCLRSVMRLARQTGESSAGSAPVTRVAQPESNSAVQPMAQATLWIEQFAELFATSAEFLVSDQTMELEAIEPGSVSMGSSGSEFCFLSDGGSGRLEVQFATPVWSALSSRYLAILPLAALATATWWLSRQPERIQRARDWPEAWALTVGLVAWYFLRISSLGMALAVFSAVLLAQRLRRERKSPRHDSSKLPNSIPEEMA